MVPPPPETEGLFPCEAEDVFDNISTPVVCAEVRTRSWVLDEVAQRCGLVARRNRAVVRGAEEDVGIRG